RTARETDCRREALSCLQNAHERDSNRRRSRGVIGFVTWHRLFISRRRMSVLSDSYREQRILVADDDRSIRQLVTTIVRREHFEVDSAADGFEAIDFLKQHEYAVILLDLMMPRVDGFGVIRHLRENPPTRKPIILVISAYADQKFKEVDPEIVAGVIRKPFEVADLGS